MPLDAAKIKKLLGVAALPLAGAAAGGTTGAIFSDEGATGRGALQGALLGAGAGIGSKALQTLLTKFKDKNLATVGAVVGGGVGGLLGQRRVSPWVLEKLKMQHLDDRELRKSERKATKPVGPDDTKMEKAESAKESTVMGIQDLIGQARASLGTGVKKEAAAAAAAPTGDDFEKRSHAFEFGLDAYLADAGLDKRAVAQAAGVPEHQLSEATLNWAASHLDE